MSSVYCVARSAGLYREEMLVVKYQQQEDRWEQVYQVKEFRQSPSASLVHLSYRAMEFSQFD